MAAVVLILPLSRWVFRRGRIITWQLMVVQRWRGKPAVGWESWFLQGVDFLRSAWGAGMFLYALGFYYDEGSWRLWSGLAAAGAGLALGQGRLGVARAGEYYAPAGFVAGIVWAWLGSGWMLVLLVGVGLWLADWYRDWSAYFWAVAGVVLVTGPWLGYPLSKVLPVALLAVAPALPVQFSPAVMGLPAVGRRLARPIAAR